MKILVTYKSKTGFTKKYAEMVAEEVECTLMEFKKVSVATMSEYDVVVFGTRMHAGFVDGFKKAYKMYQESTAKEFAVFATGGMPNEAEDVVKEMWHNNLNTEELAKLPHFYMQAGLSYEKMAFGDKLMMKMAAKMMSKQEAKSDYDREFAKAIQGSYDISDKKYAEPLVAYLASFPN
nr:flavodoxin domain-containing protein [Eubacterium sp.]